MIEGEAKRIELGFVPTGTESENNPTTTHLIERIRHLGKQRGIAKSGAEHRGA